MWVRTIIISRSSKRNNVWGAVLTEETLTSDLIGVGVGTRNLKEIGSDRGAEAYDFIMAAEIKEKEAAERLLQEKDQLRVNLDQDLVSLECPRIVWR